MGSYESTCFCDDELQRESNTIQKKMKQMRVALPTLAAACDRHGVSDRAAATLATAVLQDMQIVHQGDTTQVIDRSKVRRERHKKRGDQATDSNTTFCGRTIIQNKMDDGKFHRQTIMEEHVSIVLEPGSSYFTHLSPTNGASESIARAILKCLETKSVDMVQIQAIGCNGTVVNTGVKKGVIRLLETSLNRPLQWLVCQLYTNELLLRHLFVHIDGATSGPQGFTGPIGKAFASCHTFPVCNYDKIEGELSVIDSKELSADQKYLHDICSAVINGHCSFDLSLRNPRAINHDRWLTTGNRILRMYIGSENPIPELITLATFVIRVYAPTVFTRFVARALIFFNLTHCRAPIQTGVYLSTGACYFQSKITTKIIVEDKYFTTFNLSPYDLIIT